MRRREFIKLTGLAGAGAAAGPLLGGCGAEGIEALTSGPPPKKTPTVCNICFWKCAGFAYERDGQPWKIVGHPDDPHCNGRLCTRGTGGIGAYTDPDRLRTPLLRVEGEGEARFEPVSWERALGFIAERMEALRERGENDRVALFSHGDGGKHFSHLLRAFGSHSAAHPSFAQCRGPRDTAFKLTYGESVGSPDCTDMEHSRCVALIGSHIGENLHNSQVQSFTKALERGATVIVVDPRFSVAAGKADYWLPIRPGTDIALLLAWMNVLIGEELYDRDYIERYAFGFDALSEYVRHFPPEWAYVETGIEPDLIRVTARALAQASPAALVHPGRHATWYGDDTQRSRAIALLNALLGSWGRRGGFYLRENVELPRYPVPDYPKPKSTWRDVQGDRYPFADQAITNELIRASIGEDAHYKAWLVYSTNLPITIPDIRADLERAAELLDLVVVVDVHPAEVTGYADVILPECSYLERWDPLRNSAEQYPSLALRAPAYEPLYDSKPAWWMAKQLGERLGLGDYFPWQDYSETLDWQLQQVGSSLEEMRRLGVKRFDRAYPMYFAEGEAFRFRTPTGKIELYSQQLEQAGLDPMPRYTRPPEPPEDYFHLNYGRTPAHTFGRTTNNPLLFELQPENVVWVNPLVARRFGLATGGYVRLKNQNGVESEPVRIRVTERIRPDSVFLVHGFGQRAAGLRLANGCGADDAGLMSRVLIDPVMGGTGMRGNFVTFVVETA
jgi:thiosulfate reductase/polysulfide reductase chain A